MTLQDKQGNDMDNQTNTLRKPAGWRLRIAYAIDLCILYIIGWNEMRFLSPFFNGLIVLGLILCTCGGYFAFFEQNGKGSLGKKAVGLAVLPEGDSSFWRVFFSYWLDGAFGWVLVVLLALISTPLYTGKEDSLAWFAYWAIFGFPVVLLIYYSFSESIFGCSLGKKICKLCVYQKQK